MIQSKCPAHVLTASINERLRYFVEDVIVDHSNLNKLVDELDATINPLLEQRLVLLVGGTGTGKTAALRRLVERRLARNAASIAANPQLICAMFIEIEAPDKGPYLFSSLYSSALREMNCALVNRTLPMVQRLGGPNSGATIGVEYAYRPPGGDDLKLRFVENLVEREIEVLGLDEAKNLFKISNPRSEKDRKRKLEEQADKLRTFANTKTPTTPILAGAYDFYDLILTTGQNARRGKLIHLEPYTMTVKGLEGFAGALIELIAHLPIEHSLDPTTNASELFLQCLGCIGTLKTILNQALHLALIANKRLTIEHVRRSYYPTAQLEVMREEMNSGIELVREVLTMSKLAEHASAATQEPSSKTGGSNTLAPGETKPSHRGEAVSGWKE